MLMEWLELKITKRIQEVSEVNCEDVTISDAYDKFDAIMKTLIKLVPDDVYVDTVGELEVLMSQITFLSEDLAYRKGLADGMKLHQDMQKILSNDVLQ